MKIILPISFSVMVCLSANGQPGALDASFGDGGKILTDIDQTRNVTNSVLIQPDGKIVVAGYCTPVDYTGYFTLVRYNTDGSLDNNFGQEGKVATTINGEEDIAFSGAIQSDGKIIAAGHTWTGVDYDFAMVRYNADGTRDLSFGAGGIVMTDIAGRHDKANQVLIDSDGNINLIGYTGDPGYNDIDMAFAKYDANGFLLQGFGTNGIVTVPVGGAGLWESARAAAFQPDGKLVVVGYTDVLDDITSSIDLIFAGLRLNVDGSLDQTFANGGILKMAIAKRAIGTAVVVTHESKIVVLLETKTSKYGTTDFTLMGLTDSGTVDASFGSNGFRTVSFDNSDDSGSSLVLQVDHKILAAGYTAVNNGSTVDFALARFDTSGNLDNSFGNGGKVTMDFQGGLDFGAAIAIQKNGKIVMAGAARVGNDYDFGLVRFQNDAALPVKLVSLKAKPGDNGVTLSWITSSENNSDYFEIQRSADSTLWTVLDTIEASHFTVAATNYSLFDRQPLAGKSYYRLKMIDFDRSFAYSSIVSADFKEASNVLSVYPNPTDGKVQLNRTSTCNISNVKIFSANGNLVTGAKQ